MRGRRMSDHRCITDSWNGDSKTLVYAAPRVQPCHQSGARFTNSRGGVAWYVRRGLVNSNITTDPELRQRVIQRLPLRSS